MTAAGEDYVDLIVRRLVLLENQLTFVEPLVLQLATQLREVGGIQAANKSNSISTYLALLLHVCACEILLDESVEAVQHAYLAVQRLRTNKKKNMVH